MSSMAITKLEKTVYPFVDVVRRVETFKNRGDAPDTNRGCFWAGIRKGQFGATARR